MHWLRPVCSVVCFGSDVGAPGVVAVRKCSGKCLASAWQRLGKWLASGWQVLGKCLASAWQRRETCWCTWCGCDGLHASSRDRCAVRKCSGKCSGKCLEVQCSGKCLASAWQVLGNAGNPVGAPAAGCVQGGVFWWACWSACVGDCLCLGVSVLEEVGGGGSRAAWPRPGARPGSAAKAKQLRTLKSGCSRRSPQVMHPQLLVLTGTSKPPPLLRTL